jgi:hypothetical protein
MTEEFNHSIRALVLRFENAPDDGTTARAIDVIAKLLFRSSSGVTEQAVDYGVWVNSPCNCTDMDVGDTRELVLICAMEGKLLTFDDRREANHSFYSEWSWLHSRPVDGLESVEIRLIDQRTGATRTFTFRILYDGSHFNCAPSQEGSQLGPVFEDGVYWHIAGDKRVGPFCPTCLQADGKTISLVEGASRGTFSCPIHGTSFWTEEFRRRF